MSISALSLQEFRYLVAIADTGSFTGAAAECFVTQPTLSTQLKKLENSLGVRLVERTNKSARLTPVGERVVERARMVLAECEAIAELARSAGDPFGEPLRLGIIATLGPYLLPRLLPVLKKSLPRLDLIIREGLTKDLLERLQDHRLDCVLLALPDREGACCQAAVRGTILAGLPERPSPDRAARGGGNRPDRRIDPVVVRRPLFPRSSLGTVRSNHAKGS